MFAKVPKCLEDKTHTKFRYFSIKTSDGRNFAPAVNYCEKCNKYILENGMEKDIKKVALDHVQTFNRSYEFSDIVDVKKI